MSSKLIGVGFYIVRQVGKLPKGAIFVIGDLSRQLNEAVQENQLFSLIHLDGVLLEKIQDQLPSFSIDKVIEIAELLGVDQQHFYYVNKEMANFCYYEFPVYVTIEVFDEKFIETLMIKERIDAIREVAREALETKDYYRLYAVTEDSAKILLFNKLYWMAPDEMKYEMYREIYTLLDYGHGAIQEEIKQDVWNHQPASEKRKVRSMLDQLESGDTITIYRGEGKSSTPYHQSMSWTTSLTVAAFFATRIRSDLEAKVYKSEVRKEDVLDYDHGRREQEVRLFPEHLLNVEQLPMMTLKDILEPMQSEGYMDEYFLYKNTYIKEQHYRHPKGIHGVSHVKRVLFHAMELSRALGLSDADRAILANASVYHDIGRVHDGHCTMHGEWSWKQFVKSIKGESPLMSVNCVKRRAKGFEDYDLSLLSKDDEDIVRFLVEYHCRNDEDGMVALRKKHLHSKARERYWRLFLIFKDCDGLDRVRLPLDELDVRFFRTEQAKERLIFAYQVQNITQQL